jgi:hypothetical protein
LEKSSQENRAVVCNDLMVYNEVELFQTFSQWVHLGNGCPLCNKNWYVH